MIGNKKVLAIIPARGGSKGLPRKNIREVAGKPLIAWTIEASNKSKYIDRVVVSTDDQEIADIATQWGGEVPFLRPHELARDDSPGIAPVIHMLEVIGVQYDLVVLLQPTSPLRTSNDIDSCIRDMFDRRVDKCISVCEAVNKPFWMYRLSQSLMMQPLFDTDQEYVRRQDMPVVYVPNGAIYVSSVDNLLATKTFFDANTLAFIMGKESSIDIDDDYDLIIADCLLKKRTNNAS